MPVSYRPLTPLTTAFEYEFGRSPEPYTLDRLSILIAECLSKDDHLYAPSIESWRKTSEQINAYNSDKLSCAIKEFGSLQELQETLAATEIDLLIISAHGVDNEGGFLSGIKIGQDPVFDLGINLPKIVMFSSCSVWRRGNGATSIANLALRHGAHAVLGTLFPVRADHNAVIVQMILMHIRSVMDGTYPGSTLEDAVHWALSSSSIFDIAYGSRRWRDWLFRAEPGGEAAPIADLLSISQQQLRPGHIYDDAEKILCGMARKRDKELERSMRQYLASSNYVPESLFYVLLGVPDRIILKAPDFGLRTVRDNDAQDGA